MPELCLTGSSHVDALSVSDEGVVAVATSMLTGELWGGSILLLRPGPDSSEPSLSITVSTASGNSAVLWAGPGLVASGDDAGDVSLWRFAADALGIAGEDPRPIATYREHEDSITCLACSKGGQRLASGSQDGTVKVWPSNSTTMAEHSLIHTSPDPWCNPGITDITFLTTDTLVSVAMDGLVRLWDLRMSDPSVRSIAREAAGVCSVTTANDTLLIGGTQSGDVISVDLRSGGESYVTQRASMGHGAVRSLCVAPGATNASRPLLAAAYDSGDASVINVSNMEACAAISGHSDRMSAIGWLGEPQGNKVTLVSGGWDKAVRSHTLMLYA